MTLLPQNNGSAVAESNETGGNQLFPVFLKLNQLHTVLIGAGNIGLEKLTAIVNNSPFATVTVIARTFLPEIHLFASEFKGITILNKSFSEADLDNANLVIAATNDNELNAAIVKAAHKRNLLVNIADKPDLCDFYLGSIVQKGDLKLAISTNGKSPTVAKRLKEVLNESIPAEIDTTLQQIADLRKTLSGDFADKVKKLNEVTAVLVDKTTNVEKKILNSKDFPENTFEMNELVENIKHRLFGLDPVAALTLLEKSFPGKIVFSTSFGWEDQVITHMIFSNNIPIKVFTLETGRLFPETYYTWNRTMEIYGQPIHAYYPQHQLVEQMVNKKGPNSFYNSVDDRKECCAIRKVEPLRRALSGNDCWITGIRAEQSANREFMNDVEWDDHNKLIKFHPVFNWTLDEIKEYIKVNNIPYNILHDRGFPSIGCAPCTRAVAPSENFRSGRWWWEDQSKKECGLHTT